MKILLIAFAFPPYNSSGAVRVGKFARFLREQGHDVKVLTARDLPYPATLASEVPAETVIATPWLNVNAPLEWLRRRLAGGAAGAAGGTAGLPGGWRKRLVDLYRALTNLPDGEIGWYPWAVAAGQRLLRQWQPDVIYASALPFTGHLIAARLVRQASCPWIAEFRDLFADNPYIDRMAWRLPLDRWIERRVLAGAAATVTVSEPLADSLRRHHGKPGLVLLNGYDPADFATITPEPPADDRLTILYTGIVYAGRRDPATLFAALAQLGPLAAKVRVVFRGLDLRGVAAAAERHGVAEQVDILPPVPYRAALAEQAGADILLLLMWDDPREFGVYTGKLFEYVGAGRPILVIGCSDGVAAALVRDRALGAAVSGPDQIAAQLRRWIEEKAAAGRPAAPPATAKAGLSRAEQFARAETLMADLAAGRQPFP